MQAKMRTETKTVTRHDLSDLTSAEIMAIKGALYVFRTSDKRLEFKDVVQDAAEELATKLNGYMAENIFSYNTP